MTKIELAIIGDRFMKVECFENALRQSCGEPFNIRRKELPWPDLPMEHGYQKGGLEGLKEYQGVPEELVRFLDGAEILVNHLAPVSRNMLERLPDLRLIVVSRGGPTNIDMNACRERGVIVKSVPGRNAGAVAEFTLAAILIETRNIRRGHESLRAGRWEGALYRYDRTGRELCQMTVGLIGYGKIGTLVVKLLKPFGCRILVCDPYAELSEEDRADGVEQVELNSLLENADVISLHPRVTGETERMIDRDALARMKDGVYLINTARGPLMDYPAVYDALVGGKIRGAMLETFAHEPPDPNDPLLKLESVTLTPHIAGSSVKTVHYAAEKCAEKVCDYLKNPGVDPSKGAGK